MADELLANLNTYKLQLQQVEASLTTDSDNEDLLKLKKDLQNDLTRINLYFHCVKERHLLRNKQIANVISESSSKTEGEDEETETEQHDWKEGEVCLAIWSEDGQYYEAKVDEVLEDGTCSVTFDNYGNTDVTQVSLLKKIDQGVKRSASGDGGPDSKKPKSKRDLIAEQKEYKRKKNQKKAQRLKQMEEEREQEKNKWLDFNAKAFSKSSKGKVKKSIFATPDHANGRVGVGTCGQGGKPMTSYQHAEKWRK